MPKELDWATIEKPWNWYLMLSLISFSCNEFLLSHHQHLTFRPDKLHSKWYAMQSTANYPWASREQLIDTNLQLGSLSAKHPEKLISGLTALSKTCIGENGLAVSCRWWCFSTLCWYQYQTQPRKAFFVKKRKAGTEESLGEICGEDICPFPPGIQYSTRPRLWARE